ncbi:MAG: PIN domain-containing protein [Timaviella obliquedivisa GSE-PSE-MK23-08B]|nr:PIN domain-containing protein [Timaviella obliquedivisa GSE-PSE-MK23-08B]
MTDSIFLDTNLWVYLYSQNPAIKTQRVEEIIRSDRPRIQISTQTLGELFHVLVRKKLLSQTAYNLEFKALQNPSHHVQKSLWHHRNACSAPCGGKCRRGNR